MAALPDDEWVTMEKFGFRIPKNKVKSVPLDVLHPSLAWTSKKREKEYPEQLEKIAKVMPLKKIGRPDDIVGAVLYFASNKVAGHATGQVLSVSGGYSMIG